MLAIIPWLIRMALGIGFRTVRILIPDGIGDVSPGSRRVSDENPGILVGKKIRPRQRVVDAVEIGGKADASGTPFRVRIH